MDEGICKSQQNPGNRTNRTGLGVFFFFFFFLMIKLSVLFYDGIGVIKYLLFISTLVNPNPSDVVISNFMYISGVLVLSSTYI